MSPPSRSARLKVLAIWAAFLASPSSTDSLDIDHRPVGVERGRELGGAPHHPFGDFVRADAGEQALGGAPGPFDRLLAQIVDHLVVDPVRGAAQRQFAQCGQVAGGEEILGRAPSRFGHIHLALVQTLDEFVRRDVDEDHVGRLLQDAIRHRLAHDDAGDARDDVGEALEMLDVHRRPDVDAGRQQLLHVLPALGMPAFRCVGVGELVDDDQLGLARQRRVDVEFGDGAAVVFENAARQDLEPLDERARFRAPVGLDEADDDVDAFLLEAARVLQHRIGFPDAGRGAEKHLQPAHALPAERRQERVRVRASAIRSARLGHEGSSFVTTTLADPAPNSAEKCGPGAPLQTENRI